MDEQSDIPKHDGINTHPDPREYARNIAEYLDLCRAEDSLYLHHGINALHTDATSLLLGIAQGKIRSGVPRIAEQLIKLVEGYPAGCDPIRIIEAIAAVGEGGLSVDQPLPGVLRIPKEPKR